jgi:hypothetical protein
MYTRIAPDVRVLCCIVCLNETTTSNVPAAAINKCRSLHLLKNSAASTPYGNHNVSSKLFVRTTWC